MNRQPEHLVYRWMHHLKIPVSSDYIKEKLLAHSDYPSLVSITDILDELNIQNGERRTCSHQPLHMRLLLIGIKFFVQSHIEVKDAQLLLRCGTLITSLFRPELGEGRDGEVVGKVISTISKQAS